LTVSKYILRHTMQARKPTLITEGKCRLHQPEDKHGYLHTKDMRRTHIITEGIFEHTVIRIQKTSMHTQ